MRLASLLARRSRLASQQTLGVVRQHVEVRRCPLEHLLHRWNCELVRFARSSSARRRHASICRRVWSEAAFSSLNRVSTTLLKWRPRPPAVGLIGVEDPLDLLGVRRLGQRQHQQDTRLLRVKRI